MLINYFRIAFRNIKRQGIYAFINIFGLAIGLASFILISLWIIHESSYERIYKNADNIHQVYKTFLIGDDLDVNSSLPYLLGPTLMNEFPEALHVTRAMRDASLVSHKDKHFRESEIGFVDTSYFNIFNCRFIKGNPAQALEKPFSAVITEDIAIKYFGEEDPIGKVLVIDHEDQYVVSAVIENVPDNTYMNYHILLPITTALRNESDLKNWYSHFIQTYMVLPAEVNRDTINTKLTRLIRSYLEEDATIQLMTQPITKRHLYNPTEKKHRAQYVHIFLLIGLMILFIACINYMNMSTALSVRRAREIGLKKVVGANRGQLAMQFLGESFLQTLFALLVAMTLVELLRPYFNELTGKTIFIPYSSGWFLISLFALLIITTFTAGAYPALLLSSYKPSDVFRGKVVAGKSQVFFRKTLVTIQFSISIGLIISSLLIYSQLKFVIKKDIGFDKENLISLPVVGDLNNKYQAFRNDLVGSPNIVNVCRTSQYPSHIWNIMRGITWEGNESTETFAFGFAAVDYDYLETVGLELVSGRNFSKDFGTDTANYIINEVAAEQFAYDDPIGKKMGSDDLDGRIIGVVKNFNTLPLHYELEPALFRILPDYYWRILIRIRPEKIPETIEYIENTWNAYVPGFPFEHTFVAERIARSYIGDERIGRLAATFTLLAILITCIGLFSLASHTAQQKTKEIGIRKVFGASVQSILAMFIKSFVKWVLIANLIAWPLAYVFIINWLNNFAYRVDIPWYIFILSAVVALVIAVLTVSYQSFRAANKNPVDALRYE